MAERNEAVEMDRGSRSALTVASESRETDPRKPVSSQGGVGLRNCHWETRDELRVVDKRVNATVADSNGQQNRKTEEPDARKGRVRICGGALNQLRALPGIQTLLPTGRPDRQGEDNDRNIVCSGQFFGPVG